MQYVFSSQVMETLDSLDEDTRRHLFSYIMALPEFGDTKALEGRHAGQNRLRIGEWRVIYSIEGEDEDAVLVSYILAPREVGDKAAPAPAHTPATASVTPITTEKAQKADERKTEEKAVSKEPGKPKLDINETLKKYIKNNDGKGRRKA